MVVINEETFKDIIKNVGVERMQQIERNSIAAIDEPNDQVESSSSRSISVAERNRGKFNYVRLEEDVVEANTQTIIQLHNDIEESMRTSLEKALQIGELLFEQKKRIKHGKFTRWAVEFLPFTIRTAQNYMKLHNFRDELRSKNITSLVDAYMALKGEATPDEIIDIDDSTDVKSKWTVTKATVDDIGLPAKKAKGLMEKIVTIDEEIVSRIENGEYPYKNSKERYVKIVVSIPNPKHQKSALVGNFIYAASKLLKPGGKIIFHKK